MEIVIKIPEEVYKNIQSKSTEIQAEGYTVENAILNGIPLPKGHGALKDADEIKNEIFHDGLSYYKKAELIIDNVSAIIEADKLESEDK